MVHRRHIRRVRHENNFRCGLRKSLCRGISVCAMLTGCAIIVTVIFVLFLTVFQPCVNDSQCTTSNPCTVDYCKSNLCRHDYIDDCCYNDKDCEQVECHDVYCNKVLNKCSASQHLNGSTCNDRSACTVNDRCLGGKCVGNTLLCNDNQCMEGTCDKVKGCVYKNKEDDSPCSDGSECTVNDVCYNGQCTAGILKDCSSFANECNSGICDSSSGQCISMPVLNGTTCNKAVDICEEPNSKCYGGTCVSQPKDCFDSNPCTVEKCVEGIGCMIQYNYSSGVCLPGCQQHEQCPGDFLCIDGTCVDIPPDSGINVRFIDYQLDNCTSGGHRLLMSFIMDAEIDRVVNDVYYRVVKEASHITTSTLQPLGFVDEVLNLDSTVLSSSSSRTGFTLATQCQTVDATNCNTIFADRKYTFDLQITHCMEINTEPLQQCVDPNIHVQTSVDVSIADCSGFSVEQSLQTYSDGVFWYDGLKYTGVGDNIVVINASDTARGYAGIETNIYNNSKMFASLYSVRLCVPNEGHHLAGCVDSSSSLYCPYRGCYGWSPLDNPMLLSYDLMERGYVTAIAKSSIFNAYGCYQDEIYTGTDSEKCQQPKCPTAGWPYVMDDGMSLLFDWINEHPELDTGGLTVVFDMVYKISSCFNLRTQNEITHKLTKIKIV